MLDRQLSGSGHVRIEALVFLSHPEVDNKLEPRLHPRVVTRANFVEAITHGVKLDETLRRTTINRPMMRAVLGDWGKPALEEAPIRDWWANTAWPNSSMKVKATKSIEGFISHSTRSSGEFVPIWCLMPPAPSVNPSSSVLIAKQSVLLSLETIRPF